MIFDFHGFGHSAAGVWKVSRFGELAQRDGFIMVYPDGLPVVLGGHTGAGWQISSVRGNRDLAFVKATLDHLEKAYCIDRNRVFATGFSNGAWFSSLLGCLMSDRFAAVAPVGGGRLTLPCRPGRAVPVLMHHGRKDERVPVEEARKARDAWVKIDGCRKEGVTAWGREGLTPLPADDIEPKPSSPRARKPPNCEYYEGCRSDAEVVYCEDDSPHTWPLPATKRIWEFFRRHPMTVPAALGQ
jgi:polyhydroxybutyrate depolymerase